MDINLQMLFPGYSKIYDLSWLRIGVQNCIIVSHYITGMNIHQQLRERKAKKTQYLLNKKLRAKRNFKNRRDTYIEELDNKGTQSQGHNRKIEFYDSVFQKDAPQDNQQKPVTQKVDKRQKHEDMMQQRWAQKQEKERVKETNKKLIKKMRVQKTRRGQPIMKNYLNYALFKLQQENQKV